MSIFQSSVVTKHLKTQNKEKIAIQWELFKNHFHNPTIQENIRNSKEEQYQGEFLIDLFVNVLGYIKNPTPNFNITTEYKNVKDSKKADGAIIVADVVKAVIELKGTNTTDLGKIEVQAFGYKNNQPECTYVITSNFEKLRFYIDNAIEHIEFNLFTLTEKDFELLYLCLSYENIEKNIPKKLKEESLSQEDAITKKLYNDYSLFKRELHQSLVILNPQFDALTLFQKSQKLLDRFLFLFFAEDRQLLPPNSVRLILNQWQKLKELDAYTPLFDRFKKYFGYLNTGHKGKQYDVYAYNGGLFLPDEVLDTITIDDDLLYKHTLKLSDYDFISEVDVNILGHIFENSLNELDEIKALLEGKEVDKSKTKRKKDGVFYTPKYITKYIVENTVGKLCEEKKAEFEIIEDDYITDRKRQKKTIKGLVDKLTEYRNWLLQITICDPACGSGAFLNQALDFLISEHRYIDELQAKLFGDAMVLSDVEKGILENNLFGVDLNEESVEIAKLSLWLRTAQPNRKLNDLNNNIKCGNSIIDDPEIAGDKAFNWQKEFPQIFAKGGFDVVIGNPPYVRQELISDMKPYLQKKYKCYNGTADLYTYFYERGLEILNLTGVFGYITPNKFIESNYGKNLREYLTQYNVYKIIDFGELPVFSEASTFPCIVLINKKDNKNVSYTKIQSLKFSDLETYINENSIVVEYGNWLFISNFENTLLEKISHNKITLKEYVGGEIKFGLKTGLNEAYVIDENKYNEWVKSCPEIKEIVKPFVNGTNSRKYNIEESHQYVILAKIGVDLNKYPIIYEHLLLYKNELEKRSDKGNYWYELRTCSYYDYFEKPKIIYPDIALESRFSIDYDFRIPNATLFLIPKEDKYLLSILNSKVAWFYFKNNCPVIGDKSKRGRLRLKTIYVSNLPIPDTSQINKIKIEKLVDYILSKNLLLNKIYKSFIFFFTSTNTIQNLCKKLENWHELEFVEFINELNKAIKKEGGILLNKKVEFEWLDLFEENKHKAQTLKTEINKIEKEIDALVYELYGLTKEEIEIVENS